MSHYLSQRLRTMQQSQTMALNERAKELQQQGYAVVNLTAGEPDFYTPQYIKDAAKAAVDANFSFYTAAEGYADLRAAIADKLQRENNLTYSTQQIVVCNGAKHALAESILSVVDSGDEVVIPAPYWVSYSELVKLAGGTPVVVPAAIENGFKITPPQLEQAITRRTKLFILCSPCNPSGAVYTRSELHALDAPESKHENVLVLSDEIYEHINYVGSHESIAQFADIFGRTAIINGVSKAYAMTGYRIGYLAAPQWWAAACVKLQGHLTSNASTIAQKAAAAALAPQGTAAIQQMTSAFLRRRTIIMDALRQIPLIRCLPPDGAFYVFPDVSAFYGKTIGTAKINSSTDFCMYLLEHALLAAVPGSAFGEERCIRLSFAAADEDIKRGMQALQTALAQV